ncbi:carboxylesterase family protein [Stappia indica]|uniref:carboxylesterase family protein n=1 Tax=Stappia indica TaxID=538381 RepID=UPI001CD1CDB6|nr:carboxylesterase family protein [Stappia indica]MCA1300026.1 carboxylesterase family protein [Stappia indica]
MADRPGRPSARLQHDGVKVDAWYGLRYAETPARFAPPAPAGGRLEVETLSEVPIFPQRPSRLAAAMGTGRPNPQAEDAFFINVWAPSDAQGLPVLLFVHGGAWMTGGGAMDWYDGRVLASRGLVVVTVNYRLGALGHLGRNDAHALPLPAADLLQALHWLRDRTHSFGGDPDRITVAGQSAGGWYAHLLSVLPQTRGLLHRVSLMSMGTRRPWSPRRQADVTRKTAEYLGAAEIDHAPVDEVMRAGLQALGATAPPPALGHAPSAFLPVASAAVPDRLFDPEWAAKACHAEAVSLRTTAEESAMFLFTSPDHKNATQAQVDEALSSWAPEDLPATLRRDGAYAGDTSGLSPYRQLVAASSWRQFQRFPAQYHAALREQGHRSHLEIFAEESAMPGLHSGHCLDLPFQFGRRCAWDDAPMLQGCDAERFEAVSRRLIGGLVAFVTGEAPRDQAPITSST